MLDVAIVKRFLNHSLGAAPAALSAVAQAVMIAAPGTDEQRVRRVADEVLATA